MPDTETKPEITVEDIKAYLATLAPDAEAGTAHDTELCLVARALKHKYGETFYVGAFSFWSVGPELFQQPQEIAVIVEQFDEIDDENSRPVTRAEVEAAMPQLKGE